MKNVFCARNYFFCEIFEKVKGSIVGISGKRTLQFQINKIKISHKQKIKLKIR